MKTKTRKSVAKRFKVNAGGKVFRGHQASRHRKLHKSKRRIRSFAEPVKLATKYANVVKSLIGK
ncbi:50S ribosomal protein L35 [Candidatus Gottesmanbacteria bacterium]|nr:50S ribosomal protein L35 [Candidatus Gottesmanbacteria bacterium]